MPTIQFATQSYRHPSLPLSAQRCLNMYSEKQPQDAKSLIPVLGVPGLTSFAVCGTGPIRGMHIMNSILYAVSGGTLYSVSSTGTVTSLGSTIAGTGVVSMSDNGTQLCIVSNPYGYIYTVAGGFQAITSTNFNAADIVTFFDDYFVFNWSGTNKFFLSAILDGTTYSGLDFASAEVQPQNVISIVNQQENLLIFCTGHTETWYDSGALSFPFQRYDGATIERGCTGNQSPVKEDNSVFFLGDDLIYYRLNGIIPVRISTHALEYEWSTYSTVQDCFSFSYTYGGHKFIVVTFPTALRTFVYDISTGLWHERESWDQNNRTYKRWRGNCHVQTYGMNLIGDAINGNIGYLDPTNFTEYGNTIPAELISPPIHSDRKRVFHSGFELDIVAGVGLATGQGSNPYIMLDWSDDGGNTYSPVKPWNSMGVIGQFTQRLRWLRNGQARQRVYRVRITDPVKRTIMAAHADLSVGM
jgi:hypothetical protein